MRGPLAVLDSPDAAARYTMSEIAQNVVRRYTCSSWNRFVSQIRVERLAAVRIFRGQRDTVWDLSSAWERLLNTMRGKDKSRNIREVFARGAYEAFRDEYLERFKEHSIGLPAFQSSNLSENDWWALGRHHGLTTPLLDWTRSPYVAAFFAFLDYAEYLNPGFKSGTHQGGIRYGPDHIAVWELALVDGLQLAEEFEIFTSRPESGHRQKAQQGVFTRLNHEVHLDVEAYLSSRGLAHCLGKYEVSGQEMGMALADLALMNITPATMFPDLEGAASMANLWNALQAMGLIGSKAS